ncbi:MAG: AI-2E family transporter [Humibacillus sp.]|nr:AI-2E family transporter [Humibacillus sp.]MDN5778199.1 AI-2E family transporter [Humibacillus sp.]
MTPPIDQKREAIPRGALILVVLAAGCVVAISLKLAAGIVAPTFLALVLTIVASPVRDLLTRHGAPRWLGTLVAALVIYLGMFTLAFLIVVSGAEVAGILPQYASSLDSLLDSVKAWLAGLNIQPEQVSALTSSIDLGNVGALITSVLGSLVSVVTSVLFVLAVVLFMFVDSRQFIEHLGKITQERPAFVTAMSRFTHGTRRYLVVTTVFGAIVSVLDTLFLWFVGVPGALLWGLLAFVTNYIPNIGFFIGLLPPAILALLSGGWGLFFEVVIVYIVLNAVIQSIIQPKLVGDAVGLSATVTFLSLLVWALLLGGLGAVLAVPLTLLVKALLVDVDPRTRWMGGLLGDRSTTVPPAPS